MTSINLLGVFVAAASTMVVGFLWYGPLFGKDWMKAVGKTQEDLEKAKKGMGKTYMITFASSLVLAYFTALLVRAMNAETILAGAQTGFMIWLGFVATTHLVHYLFDGRPMKLYYLEVGQHLADLLVMGAILAVMG